MVCESESTTYRWVGDREDGFDRFEFEFKRSGVCVLNITDLKKRLDPISLVAVLQINVIVKVSHGFKSIRDESERNVMNENCCRYIQKHKVQEQPYIYTTRYIRCYCVCLMMGYSIIYHHFMMCYGRSYDRNNKARVSYEWESYCVSSVA